MSRSGRGMPVLQSENNVKVLGSEPPDLRILIQRGSVRWKSLAGTYLAMYVEMRQRTNTTVIWYTRVQDKKLVILALCEVLELPAADIPESVEAGWPQILDCIVSVFRILPDALHRNSHYVYLVIAIIT